RGQRLHLFATTAYHHGFSMEKQRAVRAELRGEARELRLAQRAARELVQRQQGRRRVAAPSAQARAHRDAFDEIEMRALGPTALYGKGTRGAQNQVGLVDSQRRIVAREGKPAGPRFRRERIAKLHRRDHRHELMKAVRSPARDGEEKVKLGGT